MITAMNRTVVRLVKSVSTRPIRRFQGISSVQPSIITSNRRCFSNGLSKNKTKKFSVVVCNRLHFPSAGWQPPASRDNSEDEISILKGIVSPEEQLTQSIKSATRTDQLLENLQDNLKSLRPNIAFHALRTLFQLYKSNRFVFP
jgi:hypothetical protein